MSPVTLESLMEVSLGNRRLLEGLMSRMDWCQEAIGRVEGWMKKEKRGREEDTSGQSLPTECVSVNTGDAVSDSMPAYNAEKEIKVEEEDWESQETWNRDLEAEAAKNFSEIGGGGGNSEVGRSANASMTSADIAKVRSYGIQGSHLLQEGTLQQDTGMESQLWSQASTSATWENTESIKVEAFPLEVCEPETMESSDLALPDNDSSNENVPLTHSDDDPDHDSSPEKNQRRLRKRKKLMKGPTEPENPTDTDGFSTDHHGTSSDTVKGKEQPGNKWFKCRLCSYKTQDSGHFKRHKIVHRSDEKPFGCTACEKRFTSNRYLQVHYQTIHIGVTPFSCDVCDKKFCEKRKLEEHKITHTGKKQHSCEICQKSFTLPRHLNYHMQLHTGERELHTCTHCGKEFGYKSHLVEHVRIHTGEKPYCCNICQKKYAHRATFISHKKTHTGGGS